MKLLSVISLGLLMASCAGQQAIVSSLESGERGTDFTHRDESSGIRYSVSHDSEYLYLRMMITDRMSMAKVARGGMRVYFDTTAKRKESVYLQYPLDASQRPRPRRERGGGERRPSGSDGADRQAGMERILAGIPAEAVLGIGDAKEVIDLNAADADVLVSLYTLTGSELVYDLAIPYDRFAPNGQEDLALFSIGIESGKLVRQGGGNRPAGGGPGGGGRRPSGGAGGPGGGGRPGGTNGGGNFNPEAMNEPINFWFKVSIPSENI